MDVIFDKVENIMEYGMVNIQSLSLPLWRMDLSQKPDFLTILSTIYIQFTGNLTHNKFVAMPEASFSCPFIMILE